MTFKAASTVALTTLLLLASPGFAVSDEEAVKKVFVEYRSAVIAGKGNAVAALLSRSTAEYYDEMRKLALHADRKEVQSQSLVNQVQVLRLRVQVPADELADFPPEGVIAHVVERGWIGKNSVIRLSPGKVVVEGDVAIIHVIVDGKDGGPGFRFVREAGNWRLDLVPTFHASNAAMQLAARREGVSDEEFVLALTESILGRKLTAEDWVAPRGVSKRTGAAPPGGAP